MSRISRWSVVLFIVLGLCGGVVPGWTAPPGLPRATPQSVGMDAAKLREIDDEVARALAEKKMPGCVVAIGRHGRLVLLKAYGRRQVEPKPARMTTDTLFDMASVTKSVATATSVMLLAEQGKIDLDAPVAKYLPEFGQNGKQAITVRQLLTHQGGLVADNHLRDYAGGPEEAWRRIFALKPVAAPGTQVIYSDVGFIVLGRLVERVSGRNLNQFTRESIFKPLGMCHTGYLPDKSLGSRAAPTERRERRWMRGEVHDPRAYLLGGVAGHAGLFSTAEDLAVYARMMLGGGEYDGVRVLRTETVERMTAPCLVPGGFRGLGWVCHGDYASNRGRTFSPRAFGHGGFTGTSLWIDPGLDLFVIFLSNRVHPDGKGLINPLAGRIGTIAADAIARPGPLPAAAETHPVLTGIDVLRRDRFKSLAGRRVGLITNQTGIARDGASTVRLLHEAPGVDLRALFSPEHGLEGKLDVAEIADAKDSGTKLPVYSLFGKTRQPTAESLAGLDTLVFDIQDIGCRFYTYVSTMGLAMQAAAEHGLRFVVLDRPNPIDGIDVEGPMLDEGRESFVAFHRLPVRHGMTVGELARLFREELTLKLDLQVIRMEGWRRGDYFHATGLPWVNPSPNMRSLDEALLYPGVGLLEFTNLSVGRGTPTPFELVGAPWLDGPRLAETLGKRRLRGVRFTPVAFVPEGSKFAGRVCGGVQIAITDRAAVRPVRTGLTIAQALAEQYPKVWDSTPCDRLLVNRCVLKQVLSGAPIEEIERREQPTLDDFLRRRARFLLY
jgi:uncharacterized protein YbbC (DUF1343 family)/CubicO group peptidase (beta-lactamase class C family)